ncbi:MAG: DUF1272 domain-containing protein [Cyclobacteriaceae bacterium]
MLELRPTCENCNKPLPNTDTEAMICSFECTYCKDCVDNVLHNVCPNCGGGFEKRPVRPNDCLTGNCIEKYPAGDRIVHKPVDAEKFEKIKEHFIEVPSEER